MTPHLIAARASRRAEQCLAAARRARGADRAELINIAEESVRAACAASQAAGESWCTYENSAGAEEIERLRKAGAK